MPERIYKLQPDRTIQLRGFDSLGASAAIHSATPNGFSVSGVFRDAADFAVVILWDADNFYEHPRLKYLPDFNFAGTVLTFDVNYDSGLQPIDSPKFNWIDWATLDCLRADGTTAQIRLWDYAKLQSGSFTAASGRFDFTTSSSIQAFDRVTLWFQNFAYDFVVPPQNPSVEYQFFAAGKDATHNITVSGRVYTHTETNPAGESSADQAAALVALINTGAGDPQVTASVGSVPYSVLLTVKPGMSGAGVVITASGNIGATLAQTALSDVALELARQINATNWNFANSTFALRAAASGTSLTLTAGRYGTVNVSASTVTYVSGTRFAGLGPGAPFTIAGVDYTIATVDSPAQLTLTAPAPTASGAAYVAERGGVDGNMIEIYSIHKSSSLQCAQASVRLSGGTSAVTWRCTLDFTALGVDQLRQCWLTFAPALANGAALASTEWQAVFTNWILSGPEDVRRLPVAGLNSVRVEELSTACVYTGAWAVATPEEGFFSGGLAKRAGSLASITGESVTVTYSCSSVHDLYIGTSLYKDRATVGVTLDQDAETDLNCLLQNEPAVNTRRRVRAGVAPGTHQVVLRVKTAGYFYFDFLEAAVLSDVPDAPPARSDLSPALDYSTDHTYKLPAARVLWIMDSLGFTGPVNQYIGVFWWNQRSNATAQYPSLSVTFAGTWSGGDSAQLSIGGTNILKSVYPADTPATIAAHFARYINGVFVGAWASATGAVLTVTSRSPAYSFTFNSSASSAAGTIAVSGALQGGQMGTWMVDPSQLPALNRGARDWHADFYAECHRRDREVVTAGSMELVNPPAGFAAMYPDHQPVLTDVGFNNLRSTHCSQGSLTLAYQQTVFDCITDLQGAAGLVPNVQFGEYLWWYFSSYSAQTAPAGGMAFYDTETAAAAQAALGRPLTVFRSPNDDPGINRGADAIFLRNRLRDHVATLVAHVKARHPNAKCEVLYPYDVNYPQPVGGLGGKLNNFINFPVEWGSKTTAGFDRLKMEALAFGGSFRNLDLARETIEFPLKHDWPIDSIRHLAAIFTPNSTWEKEVQMATGLRIPFVNMWAFDQMCIFGLNILDRPNQARSTSFNLSR